MEDHTDPTNSAVKPAIESLEGKLTVAFTLLTGLAASLGVIAAAYPNEPSVKIAVLIVAALLAAIGAAVTINHTNKRTVLKGLVAEAAAGYAIESVKAEVAESPSLAEILKNPAAIELLKSAGISLPKPPAST